MRPGWLAGGRAHAMPMPCVECRHRLNRLNRSQLNRLNRLNRSQHSAAVELADAVVQAPPQQARHLWVLHHAQLHAVNLQGKRGRGGRIERGDQPLPSFQCDMQPGSSSRTQEVRMINNIYFCSIVYIVLSCRIFYIYYMYILENNKTIMQEQ